MAHIETALRDLNRLDLLAGGDSVIHRLDPRAKVFVTLAYIVTVVSFGRYEVSALLPFAVFPLAMVAVSGIPPAVVLRKLLVVLPFAALVGLTVVTVVSSRLDLGQFNVVLALAIAALKATLVAMFFMHLRYEHRFKAVIFVSAVFFAVLFVQWVRSSMKEAAREDRRLDLMEARERRRTNATG